MMELSVYPNSILLAVLIGAVHQAAEALDDVQRGLSIFISVIS